MVRVSTTEQQTKAFWARYKSATRRHTHKYLQLCQALTDAIDDGFWAPGDKLPPEGELARLTPFSLGTAQKAYAELVRCGSVERRSGAGSFVLRTPKLLDTPWHFRFRPDADAEFRPVFPRLLKVTRQTEPGLWTPFLGHAGEIVCVTRSVRIGTEFTLLAEFFIGAGYYDQVLEGRKLEGVNLRTELGLQIRRMENDVRVERFVRDRYPLLKLADDTPLLVVSSRAHAQNPAANYLQRMIIPPTPDWLHFSDFRPSISPVQSTIL